MSGIGRHSSMGVDSRARCRSLDYARSHPAMGKSWVGRASIPSAQTLALIAVSLFCGLFWAGLAGFAVWFAGYPIGVRVLLPLAGSVAIFVWAICLLFASRR